MLGFCATLLTSVGASSRDGVSIDVCKDGLLGKHRSTTPLCEGWGVIGKYS